MNEWQKLDHHPEVPGTYYARDPENPSEQFVVRIEHDGTAWVGHDEYRFYGLEWKRA